ncbi:MAG: 3-hydroxyacyl-ACP dehydratase FabZ [Acidobacteriota bacterium]
MLDVSRILEVIPHRYPFLLVDRIVELEENVRAVGIKNVSANEAFFQGHFPGNPIMPGVLILEAMAQVGAILVLASSPDRKGQIVYFAGIDKARFRKPVVPGDQIVFRVEVLRLKTRSCKIRGEAFVEDRLVAEAEILSTMGDRPALVGTGK